MRRLIQNKPGNILRKYERKSHAYADCGSAPDGVFQPDRIKFDQDLLDNMKNRRAVSRFSTGFSMPLVETEVRLRASIGRAITSHPYVPGT